MRILNKLLDFLFRAKPRLSPHQDYRNSPVAKAFRYQAGQVYCRTEIKRGTSLQKLWELSLVGDDRGPPNEFEEGMKYVLLYEANYVPPR